MIRVIILGASGMLGSMVANVLSQDPALAVAATVRSQCLSTIAKARLPGVEWRIFEAGGPGHRSDLDVLRGQEWIVNCIGITKPLIHDDTPADVERALQVNAVLPYRIAAQAAASGARVIQIATDCVYSGARGAYQEDDPHDALDVYGKTKSLGEVPRPRVYHLRCSIVGPEPKEGKSLLEWFCRQPRRARVKGYVNHRWNGVTTLQFARVTQAIIKTGLDLPIRQHLVPSGVVTKDELLRLFARCYGRGDVEIESVAVERRIDRTLGTRRPDINRALWTAAGYAEPPGIPEMILEASRYAYRMAGLVAAA